MASAATNTLRRPPPWGLRWRSNTLFIISTIGMGMLSDLFIYGIIVPILPFILRDRVHVPPNQQQNYTSAMLSVYAAATVVFSPLAGWLADKSSSRQLPFLVGLSSLIAATVLLFVGTTIPVLMIARVAQGASSAFVWTVGLAMCIDTVGPDNLGKVLGTIFSVIQAGELAAPVVGGVLYKKSGIAAVAGVSLGILVVDFIMRALVIEKSTAALYEDPSTSSSSNDDQDAASDHGSANNHSSGSSQRTANETSPLLDSKTAKDNPSYTSLTNNDHDNDTHNQQHADLEPHKDDDDDEYYIPPNQTSLIRHIPILYCFRSPSLLTAFFMTFVQAFLLGAWDSTIPLHAFETYNFDSLRSGLLFIPTVVLSMIAGPIAGWSVDRYGTRPAAIIGFTLLTPSLILLRLPQPEPVKTQVALWVSLIAICGGCMSMATSPSMVEAGAVVHRYHERNPKLFSEKGPYAQLYGVNSMMFSAGLTLGPEVAGVLKESIGYGNMNAVIAAASGLTAILCYFFLKDSRQRNGSQKD